MHAESVCIAAVYPDPEMFMLLNHGTLSGIVMIVISNNLMGEDFYMRVAIIGSRSITMDAYPILEQFMPKGTSEIVSGGAKGADELPAAIICR